MLLFNVSVIIFMCMQFFSVQEDKSKYVFASTVEPTAVDPANEEDTASRLLRLLQGETEDDTTVVTGSFNILRTEWNEQIIKNNAPPVAEEEIDIEYDETMLRGWFAIEILMYMGQIFSNIVFVLTRACSRIRILGTLTTAIVHNNTDIR